MEARQGPSWPEQHLVDVVLGSHTYVLGETVVMPPRTWLIGAGPGTSTLEFHLMPPAPAPPAPPLKCSPPVLADFYTAECNSRGCDARPCPGCFYSIGSTHSAGSAAGCCAACILGLDLVAFMLVSFGDS